MTRNHQSHVYAGKCCRAHGEEHLLSRQEIRRLHVYIVLRLKQYAHISLHDVRPFGYRTARHYLHQAAVLYAPRHRRIVFRVGDECAVDEIPVDEKRTLQGVHRSTTYSDVGVAPRQLSAIQAFHIAQGDVHTTHECLNAVHDAHLSVVAVVHLARKRRELNRHEGVDINPSTAHTLE